MNEVEFHIEILETNYVDYHLTDLAKAASSGTLSWTFTVPSGGTGSYFVAFNNTNGGGKTVNIEDPPNSALTCT